MESGFRHFTSHTLSHKTEAFILCLSSGYNHRSGMAPLLPVELWREIIEMAGAPSCKDEFSPDPVSHIQVPCDVLSGRSIITFHELNDIIFQRFRLLFVCRDWHDIGIDNLYSHLLLRANTDALEKLDALFDRKPILCTFVKRVRFTCFILSGKFINLTPEITSKILSRFSRLEIFEGEHMDLPPAFFSPSLSLKIMSLRLGNVNEVMTMEPSSLIHLRLLKIQFTEWKPITFKMTTLVFPSLKILEITTRYESLAKPLGYFITKRFILPSLQVLSLGGFSDSTAFHLLEKFSPKIHTFHHSTGDHSSPTTSNFVAPNLRRVFIRANPTSVRNTCSSISAPCLIQVNILETAPFTSLMLQPLFGRVEECLEILNQHWPDVLSICIHVTPRDAKTFSLSSRKVVKKMVLRGVSFEGCVEGDKPRPLDEIF